MCYSQVLAVIGQRGTDLALAIAQRHFAAAALFRGEDRIAREASREKAVEIEKAWPGNTLAHIGRDGEPAAKLGKD